MSSAGFLAALEWATRTRAAHETLVYALPLAGLGVGLFYERFGAPIRGGSDRVLDRIHDGGDALPLRMTPMVAVGTVLTHLFGGSAGREGTAVQMGASLADWIAHRQKRMTPLLRRQLLIAGVAGGFGAVFGTPAAGVVFGLEYVSIGRFEWRAAVPALVASYLGDGVTRWLGIEHAAYPTVAAYPLSPLVAARWLAFAAAIAILVIVFIALTHGIAKHAARVRLPWRMALGGLVVVALWRALGTSDYLGLGVPTILRAFEDASLPRTAFAAKLLLTAVTLGAGFLGGEVTPLFFVGATAGNALAPMLGLPLALCAGVGMAAMFGAAANAPLALSVMAVELLGAAVFPHVFFVAVVAYLLTGHRSIYTAQRTRRGK